jgi:hemoglobin
MGATAVQDGAGLDERRTMTLYDQLGGQATVTSAVTVFYDRVVRDDALSQWFAGVDISRLRRHQRAFLAAALDGPQLFSGTDLGVAHSGMEITHEAFTAIVTHLIETLSDLDIAETLLDQVEARLEALRPVIVSA